MDLKGGKGIIILIFMQGKGIIILIFMQKLFNDRMDIGNLLDHGWEFHFKLKDYVSIEQALFLNQ